MSNLSKLTAAFLCASGLQAVTPAHAAHYSVVYSFAGGFDGNDPFSGLVEQGGTLYGTTYKGGASNNGTVYGVTPSGTETMRYSFKGDADGASPWGGLTSVDGALYGTTYQGGVKNLGTVFKVTPAGVKTTLYTFGPPRTLPLPSAA